MSWCTGEETASQREVAAVIERFSPRTVDEAAACFAREVVSRAAPSNPARAKALLFATSKLAAFGEAVGLERTAGALLHPSVIERFVLTGCRSVAPATRRTLRTNLRYVAKRALGGPAPVPLCRERSKLPYASAEIACYLALADAQPTERRQMRLGALICLGAGAGLMGADLRGVRGRDLLWRSGGLVVVVRSGRRPRSVPVLASFSDRLGDIAAVAGDDFVVGGADVHRRNVTTPLVSSLAGGRDLSPLDTGRLRATWLATCAEMIGLRAFMDAAGITCSQRLGDIVAGLDEVDEQTVVGLLGGRS